MKTSAQNLCARHQICYIMLNMCGFSRSSFLVLYFVCSFSSISSSSFQNCLFHGFNIRIDCCCGCRFHDETNFFSTFCLLSVVSIHEFTWRNQKVNVIIGKDNLICPHFFYLNEMRTRKLTSKCFGLWSDYYFQFVEFPPCVRLNDRIAWIYEI